MIVKIITKLVGPVSPFNKHLFARDKIKGVSYAANKQGSCDY